MQQQVEVAGRKLRLRVSSQQVQVATVEADFKLIISTGTFNVITVAQHLNYELANSYLK